MGGKIALRGSGACSDARGHCISRPRCEYPQTQLASCTPHENIREGVDVARRCPRFTPNVDGRGARDGTQGSGNRGKGGGGGRRVKSYNNLTYIAYPHMLRPTAVESSPRERGESVTATAASYLTTVPGTSGTHRPAPDPP